MMAAIANTDAATTPSGTLLTSIMHEPWQYDDQAEYVPTALQEKVSAALRTKDLLRFFPKGEGFLVQTSESG